MYLTKMFGKQLKYILFDGIEKGQWIEFVCMLSHTRCCLSLVICWNLISLQKYFRILMKTACI